MKKGEIFFYWIIDIIRLKQRTHQQSIKYTDSSDREGEGAVREGRMSIS